MRFGIFFIHELDTTKLKILHLQHSSCQKNLASLTHGDSQCLFFLILYTFWSPYTEGRCFGNRFLGDSTHSSVRPSNRFLLFMPSARGTFAASLFIFVVRLLDEFIFFHFAVFLLHHFLLSLVRFPPLTLSMWLVLHPLLPRLPSLAHSCTD